jgi:hypothetical protein
MFYVSEILYGSSLLLSCKIIIESNGNQDITADNVSIRDERRNKKAIVRRLLFDIKLRAFSLTNTSAPYG